MESVRHGQSRPAVLDQDSDEDLFRTADAPRSSALASAARAAKAPPGAEAGHVSPAGGRKAQDKWWHVPDEKIEALIQQMSRGGGGSAPSLPAVRKGAMGKAAARTATRLPASGAAADQTEAVGALMHNRSRTSRASQEIAAAAGEARRQKRVHFAADDRIGRTLSAPALGSDEYGDRADFQREDLYEEPLSAEERAAERRAKRGQWLVTDEQLEKRIQEIAAEVEEREIEACTTLSRPLASAGAALLHGGSPAGRRATSTMSKGVESGTLARWKVPSEDRVLVQIFFTESGDTVVVRLSPDLKIGPPQPPKSNRFTDIFGQGASTKGFCQPKKTFDYRYRKFGTTQRPGWNPGYSESLKSLIEHLTDIEPSRQKLAHRNHPMADDLTLRSHGIVEDGHVVSITFRKFEPREKKGELTLASSLKKRGAANWEERLKMIFNGQPMYDGSGYSLRTSSHLKSCHSGGDVWMMPKWISQSCPQLFAPCGIGVTGDGSMKIKTNFASMPIYLPDAHDSSISRVRENVTGYAGYTMAYRQPDG